MKEKAWVLVGPNGEWFTNTVRCKSESATWIHYGYTTDDRITQAKADGWRVVCGKFEETGPL